LTTGSTRRSEAAVAPAERRGSVAVIDIGSNSLRLVVYDGMRRAARMLLNEKVLCGLGRGLSETGRLNPEGVELARVNLQRFVALARAIGVARLDVLATAAVRDAADGKDFAADLERRFDVRVRVLAGAEEGRYSGLGVLSGIPDAAGVAGDLGGGSVELVPIGKGRVGPAATLPIGPLRLAAVADDERKVRDAIDRQLASVPWLTRAPEGSFYAVGGAWRALARLHMEQAQYPLHIVQQYTLARPEAEKYLELVARQSRKSLERISTISRKRLEVVPLAARLLLRLIRRIEPKELVFSATGLREGHLYSLLDAQEQRSDPLIVACAEEAEFNPRFGPAGETLFAWKSALFPKEPPARSRLRRAAALLSDIAWHEHPDYRAEQALRHVLYMPLTGVSHAELAFIALALHARYGGRAGVDLATPLELLDEDGLAAARAAGLAFRLGYTIAGGVPGLLGGVTLNLGDGTIVLSFAPGSAGRFGESVQRRLDALARALGRSPEVRGI
jgi:exopolyphosphatase/guanosine-5'-triphosphate,3'-diphosphate pyrophosphatase